LQTQGTRTVGEAGTALLAEAVAAYRQALEVFTRATLPQDWATTQQNLARADFLLKDWSTAVDSYTNVLQLYPANEEAYQRASWLSHEVLFAYPDAFALNQRWLERHPDDLNVLSDFAEKHFTTGRFAACAERLTPYWRAQTFNLALPRPCVFSPSQPCSPCVSQPRCQRLSTPC
jgi:tetratricopeptide (TPR) repeat protein